MEINMKKTNIIILILLAFVLLGGCENIYAEYSDNIEYVSAYYYLGTNDKGTEDRLQKTEMVYSVLNITPNGSIVAKGVSFDIKHKLQAKKDIYLKVSITNSIDGEQQETVLISEEKTVEISNESQKVTLLFDTPYTFDIKAVDKIINTDKIKIEFLNTDNSQNTTVAFSLNNIEIIEEDTAQ